MHRAHAIALAGLCTAFAPTAHAAPIHVTPLTPANAARATAPTSDALGDLAAALGSEDAATRRRAFAVLTHQREDALAAIERRLGSLAGARPAPERVRAWLTEFREVQGVTEGDDPTLDLAYGVLPVLEAAPDSERAEVAAVAEPLLLLRSLEALDSPRTAEIALSVFALEDDVWDAEARRSLQRFGAAMLPSMLIHERHDEARWVRRFCREGIDALGLREPGRAVQKLDAGELAAVLAAFGRTLRFDAMPVVVSYVGDARVRVRRAARAALERFGKNAIWQIREAYLNATGKDADPEWGHTEVRDALYAAHDGPREQRVAQALAEAARALDAGAETRARAALDAALWDAPADEAALVPAAPHYARLGLRALERDDLAQADIDFRRALRLDPTHGEAATWRAQLSFLEAEQRLAAGLVDLPSYERAQALDPSHARAGAVLDVLSGRARAREDARSRLVAWLAAALLGLSGLLLLRERSAPSIEPAGGTPADS